MAIKEKTNKKIEKILQIFHAPYWMGVVLLLMIIFRIPSLFEPYRYGDEMIYLTLGHGVTQGVPLYSELHDNKPPLIYLIAAASGSLFWFKVSLLFANFFSICAFYKLITTLFPKNENLHKISTSLFALLTTVPLFEGNIANAELFFIGPAIFAFYLLFKEKNYNFWRYFSAGIFFSIGTLFKMPVIFDLPAIFVVWLIFIKFNKKGVKEYLLKIFTVLLGLLIPISFFFLYYFLTNHINEYLIAAYLQNFGYLSSWKGSSNGLYFRALFVFISTISAFFLRKKLTPKFLFISLWLIYGLFAVTLSERPYPHYFVQVIAPLSILLGLLFVGKTYSQFYSLVPLTIAFFVPVFYKFWVYPTGSYYQAFIKFATHQTTKDEYFNYFGGHINRNYKIAKFIQGTTNKTDRIFVWGDDSGIYALSKRLPPIKYVADYHIKDFSSSKEIIEKLSITPPEIIVILPNASKFDELALFINKDYLLIDTIETAQIWKKVK